HLAGARQVAGQQQRLCLAGELIEVGTKATGRVRREVDVADGGDPHRGELSPGRPARIGLHAGGTQIDHLDQVFDLVVRESLFRDGRDGLAALGRDDRAGQVDLAAGHCDVDVQLRGTGVAGDRLSHPGNEVVARLGALTARFVDRREQGSYGIIGDLEAVRLRVDQQGQHAAAAITGAPDHVVPVEVLTGEQGEGVVPVPWRVLFVSYRLHDDKVLGRDDPQP